MNEQCDENVFRKIMVLYNRESADFEFCSHYKCSSHGFGLCDLLSNSGVIIAIAKTASAASMNDFALAVMMRGAEKRREWILSYGFDCLLRKIIRRRDLVDNCERKKLFLQIAAAENLFDLCNNFLKVHFMGEGLHFVCNTRLHVNQTME